MLVAAEISRLLNNRDKILIKDKPLKEGDIAVLVRKNIEAQMIQDALIKLNIPSVLFSTLNLFDTYEALEMERLLSAIAQPGNEKFLKTAIATKIIGMTGEELDDLSRDESAWEERVIRFKEYHDIWNKRGFIRMFKQFMTQEKVLVRIMKLPDGERRNTNLLHLAEVLHQASVKKKLSMSWLVKWLSEQRDSKKKRLEEYQLRLESDENAVKLVTIHKSKGLEYPIVFCPFTWDGSELKSKEPVIFHDDKDNRKATFDMGSPDLENNKNIAEKELLAENLRLLYVALTRAKHRCYLIWGNFNKAGTSAPAYLFHNKDLRGFENPAGLKSKDILKKMKENFDALNDTKMFADLEAMIKEKAEHAIHLSEIPLKSGLPYSSFSDKSEAELDYRRFSKKIDRDFGISSFSSLTRSIGSSLRLEPTSPPYSIFSDRAELPDHDEWRKEESGVRSQESESIPVSLPLDQSPNIFLFSKRKKSRGFFS